MGSELDFSATQLRVEFSIQAFIHHFYEGIRERDISSSREEPGISLQFYIPLFSGESVQPFFDPDSPRPFFVAYVRVPPRHCSSFFFSIFTLAVLVSDTFVSRITLYSLNFALVFYPISNSFVYRVKVLQYSIYACLYIPLYTFIYLFFLA